jgi:hypothetical protein
MDNYEIALNSVDRADFWANKDNVDPVYRPIAEDRALRLAQIHATLAVAQKLDKIIELVFDEGRHIQVDTGLGG